jgi:hypothetical protein
VLGDERRYLGGVQSSGLRIQPNGVCAEKPVRVVPVDLGPLVFVHSVFHRQAVQAELLADGREAETSATGKSSASRTPLR